MARYNIAKNSEKHKWRPITNRMPVLLLCLLTFGFLIRASWNVYGEKRRSEEAALAAKLELAKLEKRNIFVSEELDKLATEAGQEARLREKFGVGRAGEQVAIIVEGENNGSDINSGNDFWHRIEEFFKSLFRK